MKKGLLITSALGLVAALPSCAFADVAGGACKGGFNVGIQAGVASLKLRKDIDKKDARDAQEKAAKDLKAKTDALNAVKFNETEAARVADLIAKKLEDKEVFVDAGVSTDTAAALAAGGANVVLGDLIRKQGAQVITRDITGVLRVENSTNIGNGAVGNAPLTGTGAINVVEAVIIPGGDNDAAPTIYLNDIVAAATVNDQTARLDAARTAAVLARVGNIESAKIKVLVNTAKSGGTDDQKKAIRERLFKAADFAKTLAKSTEFAQYNKVRQDTLNATLNDKDLAALNLASLGYTGPADLRDVKEHHAGTNGFFGLTAGYLARLGQVALSGSVGAGTYVGNLHHVEHTTDSKDSSSTDKNDKLRFNFDLGVGIHYVASSTATIGFLAGAKIVELRSLKALAKDAAKDAKATDHVSKWFWAPYVGAEANAWLTGNVSVGVGVKYLFGVEFDSATDAKVKSKNRVDGTEAYAKFQYTF